MTARDGLAGRRVPAVLVVLAMALGLAACARTSYVQETLKDVPAPPPDVTAEPALPERDPAELARRSAPREPQMADKVLVVKSQRRLYLMDDGVPFETFDIALGRNPRGHKQREGDGRTPEGRYVLDWRNPESEYYRSIHVSYPSETDLSRAREAGADPGGNIMIHGLPEKYAWMGPRHTVEDWTEGCIAVTNEQMDVIWTKVRHGTPIEIRP